MALFWYFWNHQLWVMFFLNILLTVVPARVREIVILLRSSRAAGHEKPNQKFTLGEHSYLRNTPFSTIVYFILLSSSCSIWHSLFYCLLLRSSKIRSVFVNFFCAYPQRANTKFLLKVSIRIVETHHFQWFFISFYSPLNFLSHTYFFIVYCRLLRISEPLLISLDVIFSRFTATTNSTYIPTSISPPT